MKKVRVKCPTCNSVLDVPFKEGETVKHIPCPVCQTKLNLKLKGAEGSAPSPVDEEDAKTEVGGFKQLRYSVVFNGMKFPLDKGANTIGRQAMTSQAKLQLPTSDMNMSRNHAIAEVKVDANGNTYATLANYKNMNLTLVNGKPLGPQDVVMLNKGDIITMGQTTVMIDAE